MSAFLYLKVPTYQSGNFDCVNRFSKESDPGRFPFDEIFENFGWESNGTGSFPEKIFENLRQPFQCSRKVEISVFLKILVFHSKVSSRTA